MSRSRVGGCTRVVHPAPKGRPDSRGGPRTGLRRGRRKSLRVRITGTKEMDGLPSDLEPGANMFTAHDGRHTDGSPARNHSRRVGTSSDQTVPRADPSDNPEVGRPRRYRRRLSKGLVSKVEDSSVGRGRRTPNTSEVVRVKREHLEKRQTQSVTTVHCRWTFESHMCT